MHHHNNHQARNRQRKRQERHQQNHAAAGGELALHDPPLAFGEAAVPQEQHQDADAEERGAQGLAELAERVRVVVRFVLREGRVEAEELRHGYADRGECQGGA